ncbi:MAG: replication-associated recombination protein A, partial [Dehalococcoidales bacterium]|nr:replication-associated recombination protein A [Dehalococcoidales bacterium]
MDMFERQNEEQGRAQAPLAARMRPSTFNEYVGQQHIVGEGRVLRKAIEAGRLPSIVLWGPPGSGKTTLAYVIASVTDAAFTMISAVTAGVAELRKAIEQARERRRSSGQRTILFIDEIHRFNKTQQDAILPYVEDGTIILIGATTENPSFEVTSPLLSRAQVMTLNPLVEDEIRVIVMRALRDRLKGLGSIKVEMDHDAIEHLISMSRGDARIALNALELAVMSTPPDADGKRHVPLSTIEDAIQHPALRYDKAGEQHYDLISALHKSMRGSDPDASLYWLGRMLEGGEDPLYIVRRLIRFASEDIGMADPQALMVTVAAQQAV